MKRMSKTVFAIQAINGLVALKLYSRMREHIYKTYND